MRLPTSRGLGIHRTDCVEKYVKKYCYETFVQPFSDFVTVEWRACVCMQAWAVWDCVADDSLGKDVWADPAFMIYRGLGNLILLTYMWGVNIWVSLMTLVYAKQENKDKAYCCNYTV